MSDKKETVGAGKGRKKPHKPYGKEFKQEAVRLVTEQGMSQTQVAKDLGVGSNMVSRWVQQSRSDGENAFRGKGHPKLQDDELRKLEQQVKRLTMERDILKKAMAYFVDVPK